MKKIIRIILLAGILGLFGYTLYFLYAKNQAPDLIYSTSQPQVKTIINQTVATGSVVPRKEILIKPVVSGIIDELFVEAGDKIAKGDLIARIEIIPDMANLSNAENRLQRARIQLKNAEIDYNRNQALLEDGVISKASFQPFGVALENAKLEVVGAEDNLQIIRDGISKNASNSTNTLVRSTINGMVLDVPVKEGNQVIESNTFNEGTTIATVADMGEMIFEGLLDESEVARVEEGMELILTIGAIDGSSFKAALEYISPKGQDDNGSIKFPIKAAIELVDGYFIRAGYSATAAIVLEKRENALAIEERLVSFEDGGTFVMVETGNQEFIKQEVTLGLSDGVYIEVIDGIDKQTQLRDNPINDEANH